MSERNCAVALALAPYNRAPVIDVSAWYAAVAVAWARGSLFRPWGRLGRPRADKAAVALASLNILLVALAGLTRTAHLGGQ